MKFLSYGKDGGPHSTVHGFWLFELKNLMSAALLRFSNGSREEYHSHAFESVSWVFWGKLREELVDGRVNEYHPSLVPVITLRSTVHRVLSEGTSWVFTLRGPWAKSWTEFDPVTKMWTLRGHGRKVLFRWYEEV